MGYEAINAIGTAGAALADIGKAIQLNANSPWVSFTISNVGAALTDFALLISDDGTTFTKRWSGADWATAANFRDGSWIGTSNSTAALVNILPDGEHCQILIFVGPAKAIKFQATDGVGTTVVTIKGYASNG